MRGARLAAYRLDSPQMCDKHGMEDLSVILVLTQDRDR